MIFKHSSETYTVTLQRQPDGSYTAIVGDRTYAVQARQIHHGGWLLTLNGQRVRAYVAAQGDTRFVSIGGRTYTLAVPSKHPSHRKASGGSGGLTAQMPGQVMGVLVSEGDVVERGQTLMILEAMKMEIRITAPSDGIVKRLLAAEGDVVERGQLLVEVAARDERSFTN